MKDMKEDCAIKDKMRRLTMNLIGVAERIEIVPILDEDFLELMKDVNSQL